MALVIANKPSKLDIMKRLLPILLLLICSTTLAESGSYRVEVIVFRNLEAAAETGVSEELRSFSQYVELQRELQDIQPPARNSIDEQSLETADDPAEFIHSDLPDDFQIITQKSTTMDDVWRRLKSSRAYRPLVYGAWEQNRTDYYPPVRIHDQNVIDMQLRPPTSIVIADLAAEDPLAAYRSTFYQLDGSIQLRRSRFLHLFLDIEIREEQASSGFEPDFFTPGDTRQTTVAGPVSSPGMGVFNLKQNRQVRTGQLQYFDTPFFGALVFVSAISAR